MSNLSGKQRNDSRSIEYGHVPHLLWARIRARNSGRIEFPIVGTRAVVSALGSMNCLTKEGCTHG